MTAPGPQPAPWREVTAGQGTWRQTYRVTVETVTAVHEGGPADGVRLQIETPPLPEFRLYAPARARKARKVRLARYVLHDQPQRGVMRYRYTGTDEKQGPVPGMPNSPAWS